MNFTNTDCVKKEVYLDLDMLMNSNLHRKTASRPTYKCLLYHQPKRYVVYDQIKPIKTKIEQEINK